MPYIGSLNSILVHVLPLYPDLSAAVDFFSDHTVFLNEEVMTKLFITVIYLDHKRKSLALLVCACVCVCMCVCVCVGHCLHYCHLGVGVHVEERLQESVQQQHFPALV